MRRILILWLAASALFMPSAVHAEVPSYAVIKDKSFIKFFAIQNNASVEGKFSDFTADIRFDPENLAESSIRVEVDMNSISVVNPQVLDMLKMPDWLSIKAFPKAVFVSRKIDRIPDTDSYYAEGDLTLRDKTEPVSLNFVMEHFTGSSALAVGSVTLQRLKFGIGQGQWAADDVIKDAVRVEFRITAEKK
jgi:polyisoprenoid-binding protein YceI